MAATTDLSRPQAFDHALAELRTAVWRPEMRIDEIPSPQRIAPHSAAISAEVVVAGEEIGSGRLILLHDPTGNAAWQGTFRCVTLARAQVDPEMVADPLLTCVGWSWLTEALITHEAAHLEPSGTVTAVSSESFGQMAGEPPRAEVEIRASWTPEVSWPARGLTPHLQAWADLVCTVAGLPPLPAGVVPMSRRR